MSTNEVLSQPLGKQLQLSVDNTLYCLHQQPQTPGLATFVFVNALTGSTDTWEAVIAPSLRQQGYGTLSYDFRGQGQSRYGVDAALDATEITADLCHLLQAENPQQPILVGLSIGGLFAIEALRAEINAVGLVLINTLRKPGLRLDWINESMCRLVATGGFPLLLDAMLPMLVNPDKLAQLRETRLGEQAYLAASAADPAYRLMAGGGSAQWDLPYEDINVPVLVVNGLQDRIFRIAEDVAELTARIANAQTVDFHNVGHLVPIECPEPFASSLSAFAEKIRG